MATTRIKICGVREATTAAVAAQAGAWAIGLVFVEASPRFVTVEQARAIVRQLPASVQPVGLFVDQKPPRIKAVAEQVGLKLVQLHGNEPPETVTQVAPLRVIKVVKPDALDSWRGIANLEAIMFDAPAASASLPGGGGVAMDWGKLADVDLAGMPPLILAGGLTPENVADAIRLLHPFAVDVSSGVESSRGVKDPRKIRAFCAAVRQADQGAGTR